jgi:hypothetical protein
MTLRLGGDGAITGCTSLENPDLTVSGLTISGSFDAEKVLVASGTAAAPSYTFSGDTDNGLYQAGTNSIGLATAGTNAILIDSSGRVGIGTTTINATRKVEIVQPSGYVAGLRVLSNGSGAYNQFFSGTSNFRIGSPHNTNALVFDDGATERARIDSSGRLLVNTSASTSSNGHSITQVASTSNDRAIAAYNFENDASGPYLTLGKSRGTSVGSFTILQNNDELGNIAFFAADGTDLNTEGARIQAEVDGTPGTNDIPTRLVFATTADGANSPTERMRIDSSGNVGIGTTNTISVLNTSVNTPDGLGLYMENRADAGTADKIGLAFVLRRAGGYAFNQTRIRAIKENAWTGTASTINSALTFSTYSAENPAERMRINSSGNIGIGQSSPAQLLHLTSTGSNAFVQFSDSGSGGSAAQVRIGSNGNDLVILNNTSSNAATERMRIDSSGNVKIASEHLRFNTSGKGIIFGTDGGSNRPSIIGNYTSSSNNNIAFNVTGSERMRIDNTGNVGIGILSPSSLLHLAGPNPRITCTDTARTDAFGKIFSSGGSLYLQQRDGSSHGNIVFRTENSTTAVERMRILSTGGITFNGDTAAANALDDYEEGNFTMGVTGAGSPGSLAYSHNAGRYVKIGSFVFVSGYISVSNKGSHTSSIVITGLPFTVANNSTGYSFSSIYYSGFNLPAGSAGMGGYPIINTTNVQIVVDNTNSSGSSDWSYANTTFQLGAFSFMYAIQ